MKAYGSLKSIMGIPDKQDSFETLAQFSEYLKHLNKARLQELCMEGGLVPSHDRRLMIRALEKLFKREKAKGIRVVDNKKPLSKEKAENVLKALNN